MTPAGTARLADALETGTARFGAGPVTEVAGRHAARTRHKLDGWLAGFPVTTAAPAVRHGSGLVYVTAALPGGAYLVGMPRSATPPPLERGQGVQVVTGVCLFGAGALTGWAGRQPVSVLLPGGHLADPPAPVDAVTTRPGLHVYETETVATVGGFTAALAALPGVGPVTVHCHIPAAEYWLRGQDLAARGLMTAGGLAAWEDAVAVRTRALTGELLNVLGTKVTVRTESPLDWCRHPAGPRPGWWADLSPGTSLGELLHASYVYAYLAAARRAAAEGDALVFVEEPGELPIWRHTHALAAGLGIDVSAAAVCYIHPRLVATDARPACLYNVEQS